MKRHPSPFTILLCFILYGAAACGKAGFPTQTPAAISAPAASASAVSAPAASAPPASGAGASGDFSWLHIAYPTGWRETSPGRYEGVDGYAWLELRGSSGAGPGAVCMGEANRDKPHAYGAYPEIRDLTLLDQPACLILPSADQPTARHQESLYLLWVPASVRPDTLLALHADREHILAISESLAFLQPLPTPSPETCDFSVAAEAPHTTHKAGLRIDEFPIAQGKNATGKISPGIPAPGIPAPGASCSPEREPENFYQRIVSGPPAVRAEEVRLKQFQSERLGRLNARLVPFGFLVEAYDPPDQQVQQVQKLFRVLRHGSVVRSELSWIGQISLSANGQVFFMPVVDSYDGSSFLIRPDGKHDQDVVNLLAFDLVFPVYAGSDRISLAYEYERIPRATGSPALLQVLKNDQVIETFSVSGANPASGPARGLWSWENHWILELPGLVLQDGAILNDRLGYPEMFTWRLLKDRPFYFYRKDGLVHAVYDDQVLPDPYDEVLSDPQWTKKILVQMHTYESGLVFFARRGPTWYYVVLEVE